MAESDSKSGDAVVYLPQNASQTQRNALLAWVKSSQTDFRPAKLQTRVVPLQFTKSQKGYEFSAGLPKPNLSTTAGQTDLLGYVYNAAKGKWLLVAFVNGF